MTSKTYSWNDRFAAIDALKPTDEQVCSAFEISQAEYDTAKQLRTSGTFIPTPNLDLAPFQKMFADNGSSDNVTPVSGATTVTKPQTATKSTVTATPRKRGRKGENVVKAFAAIPSTPVPAEQFAQDHGVSIHVLRQGRRFDVHADKGKVHVAKDRGTKQLMIWRHKS